MTSAAGSTNPVLELRDAAFHTRDKPIFDHLDLVVRPGEFVVIIGPNGAGKTTLFRLILGLDQLADGDIRVLREPVRRGDRRIGYVPQQRIVARGTPLTGRDLVTLGRTGTRFGLPFVRRDDRAAIDRAITAVDGHALVRRALGDLSGGEQQRLRVAQAIVDDPALLLLDEPLSSLDTAHKQGIVDLAIAQQHRGATVLFISHDLEPVLHAATRALVIRGDGRHWLGRPADIDRADLHDHPHHSDLG